MSIYLITRTADGCLKFNATAGEGTNDPQHALQRYKNSNVPLAWTRTTPAGKLERELEKALKEGRTVTYDAPSGRWKADGVYGGVSTVRSTAPSHPNVAGSNAAMLRRDAEGFARAKKWIKPSEPPKAADGPTIHPPLGNFTSPDMVASSHQTGLHGSAALI